MSKKKSSRESLKVNFTIFEDRFNSNNVFYKIKGARLNEFEELYKKIIKKFL